MVALTMPTTCAVVGCKTRQRKGIPRSFYRIPPDSEHRCHWLAFINRKNEDGTPWRPGTGDRVCSDHFISGKKSNVSTHPDFVPSVSVRKRQQCRQGPGPACARFERSKNRAKKKRKQEREAKERVREQQHNLRALLHDHNYDTRREEVVIEEQPRLLCTTAASAGEDKIPADVGKVVVSCVSHFIMVMYVTECQTEDTITHPVQCECLCVHAQLQLRPEFCVRMMLEGNDKLTRYYTGLPTYNSFVAFVEYLTPKAVALTLWNEMLYHSLVFPLVNHLLA